MIEALRSLTRTVMTAVQDYGISRKRAKVIGSQSLEGSFQRIVSENFRRKSHHRGSESLPISCATGNIGFQYKLVFVAIAGRPKPE